MKKALLLMLCIVAGISAVNAGCGDYVETIETHGGSDHIVLGTVSLPKRDTYLSCRNLCRNAHPDFQFYHKFINYQSCECMKMADGVAIALKDHGAYTFGYAAECDYSRVSSENCEYIGMNSVRSEEACWIAATKLGLSDTSATSFHLMSLPRGCIYSSNNKLWWNDPTAYGGQWSDASVPCGTKYRK